MAQAHPRAGGPVSAATAQEEGALRPDAAVRREYLGAFAKIVQAVASKVADADRRALPVRMYVAGGAALYLLTGSRSSEDIDATFSRRLMLGEDIEVAYRDADGRARILYLDRNYNDTLGLMHESAYDDSTPVGLPGVDPALVEVRILSPLDLAVSKIARFSEQDRADLELLARTGRIEARSLRQRAEEALGGYVGDLASVRTSIDLACRIVEEAARRRRRH